MGRACPRRLTRFPRNPSRIRVPLFLLFSFNKELQASVLNGSVGFKVHDRRYEPMYCTVDPKANIILTTFAVLSVLVQQQFSLCYRCMCPFSNRRTKASTMNPETLKCKRTRKSQNQSREIPKPKSPNPETPPSPKRHETRNRAVGKTTRQVLRA